ncbi:MAG: E3 binding domain-containing protein, partial [Flavobacteriales bacterium]|nr:E3 binding domain-containing protein [Flavobacteriales bacterium]
MAEIVRMPKLSDTMTEGVVAAWHKKVGDPVKSGDVLAEIETDKATMEFESFVDGVLLHIGVEKGKTAPVDSLLAILGKEGEDVSKIIADFEQEESAKPKEEEKAEAAPAPKAEAPKPSPALEPASAPAPKPAPAPSPVLAAPATGINGRVKASPLARKLADDLGIDIRAVRGSGDEGRVIKRDIENYKGGGVVHAPQVEHFEEVAVSQMRKTIARRLAESKFSAPHFYLTISIDMGRAMQVRQAI